MNIKETKLKGSFEIEPKIFEDKRGYFFESFNKEKFYDLTGLDVNFVQDNESFSTKGVLRGLHYQIGNHAQAKLVRVIKGSVLDVAVDIRENSATFGEHVSVLLSEENKKQFFVPRGFAHGFVVLSETAIFSYKCDNYYDKLSERGILFNDPNLNIDWKLPKESLIISDKDLELPVLKLAEIN
ncbi:dTDP-4-dehydrorhamnose 3,5-epimerase [Hanstruepera neustonica]|uniref:dTDP-4-dehydrorhamnose 3,5-epimerase n=1 Tax=Hanstruepera neustonica TaxID=1445657 RepID=A0A2K1E3C2_9FLAO|nr:dTDP-4-dehydrorhamnose 3,5-epimerase [Hanstruepera neustonica]PNQ74790.1 dTDP-4-dehydrorhamnose 3,5-epimerase [Hanstruepera neustonica]